MSTLERWLGGSPLGVLVKLLVLSLIVGILLSAFGLTPVGLVRRVLDGLRSMFGVGLDAIRNFGTYVLMGAMIVLPLWLAARILSRRR